MRENIQYNGETSLEAMCTLLAAIGKNFNATGDSYSHLMFTNDTVGIDKVYTGMVVLVTGFSHQSDLHIPGCVATMHRLYQSARVRLMCSIDNAPLLVHHLTGVNIPWASKDYESQFREEVNENLILCGCFSGIARHDSNSSQREVFGSVMKRRRLNSKV